MVMKGQFLERATVIPVGPLVLEAVTHRGTRRPPLLVLPPPSQDGGGMDHVVCAELAWAAATAGHPTVRFNFRGVGASQGKPGGPKEQIEDAEAALRLAEENASSASVAVASLGGSALTLLELAERHPALSGVCVISPRGLEPSYLNRLKVPVLLVIGAEEAQQPRAAYAAVLAEIGGHLEVIDHADPSFTRNLPQVGRAVANWLGGLGEGPTRGS